MFGGAGLTTGEGLAPPRRLAISHRAVIRLALPMTLAHMSTPLLGFADATVIGRLGQPALLGAIAASAVIFDFPVLGLRVLTAGHGRHDGPGGRGR